MACAGASVCLPLHFTSCSGQHFCYRDKCPGFDRQSWFGCPKWDFRFSPSKKMLNSILNLAATFFPFHNSDHSTHCNLGKWESVFWRQRNEMPSNVVLNSDRVVFVAKIFNWYLILCYEFINTQMWQQQSAEIHAPDCVVKTTAASNSGSSCLHYRNFFMRFILRRFQSFKLCTRSGYPISLNSELQNLIERTGEN